LGSSQREPSSPRLFLADQEYEVEEIVGDRSHAGKTLYFVKWKGFPVSDNTWEPGEHLPPELIADYRARTGEGGSKRQRVPQKQQAPAPEEFEIEEVIAIAVDGRAVVATVRTADGNTRDIPAKEVRQRNPRALVELLARLTE
jgi:hypothetical protein